MAKIRKCKLAWEASASEKVVGYKLYWSKGTEVSYDCKFLKLGNVTEIALPDDVTMSGGPIMFGVTAIDRDGNESDMVTIDEPYQLHVLAPPADLFVKPSDEFKLVDSILPQSEKRPAVEYIHADQQREDEDPLAQAIEGDENRQPTKMKYYDDVGYRKET